MIRALLILLLFSFKLTAQVDSLNIATFSAEQLFEQGNKAYTEENFEESIKWYKAVKEKGLISGELNFNLGNAYFKTGDIPSAILYYERARKFEPYDEDILTNLEIANLKTIDKVEAKPELAFKAWWTSLLNTYLIDEWATKSLWLAYIGLAVLLLYLFSNDLLKRISFFLSIFIFTLSLIFFVLGNQKRKVRTEARFAIVFSPTVTVKSSPDNDGTKLFVIHEGTKVQLLDSFEEWTEISLMNGNKGWVKSEVYEGI